ncbi:MAG: pirin family protein [Sediminibacterium sp.]|nr:pirin family protein [Sediminibacterium sp.]
MYNLPPPLPLFKILKMTNTILHKANTRGSANHGWLITYHSFSFADYYNPQRTNFGALRVLNDDIVAGGMGFGMHPHKNMEIITIPLQGDLAHKDSMGNAAVIKTGDIQVMSAGTGILHSEFNNNSHIPVKLLQIWIIPNQQQVTPRYDQITLQKNDSINKLQQIITPHKNEAGIWIHQHAWLHITNLAPQFLLTYTLKLAGNGVYIFVIEGEVVVNEQVLNNRDGYGIWEVANIQIRAITQAKVLLIEVPMII